MPYPDDLTITSGGQTGVDRAALDVAMELGFAHRGWCPQGRRAEDGTIGPQYELQETPSANYAQRTGWNIRDSDATVIFSVSNHVRGGTALTIEIAARRGMPWLHLAREPGGTAAAGDKLRDFLLTHDVKRLNVAGPRSSQEPEAAEFARDVLTAVLSYPP